MSGLVKSGIGAPAEFGAFIRGLPELCNAVVSRLASQLANLDFLRIDRSYLEP
ncbi:hypothetical protein IWQ49_002356 [Labrenzia sp. EL_126]|nr:hypothetical protein [Labrenzia sp. EL_126]